MSRSSSISRTRFIFFPVDADRFTSANLPMLHAQPGIICYGRVKNERVSKPNSTRHATCKLITGNALNAYEYPSAMQRPKEQQTEQDETNGKSKRRVFRV